MHDSEAVSARSKMLRQGRGNGYLEALHAGSCAVEDVIACVVDDPRWDRQVEAREQYYASLLIQLDADVGPILERVIADADDADDEDESASWLAVGVLAELARRRHEPAAAAIAEAIRRGREWRACLDALGAAGGEALIRAVIQSRDVAQLVHFADAEELFDAVRSIAAPWEDWASEVPALRFVCRDATQSESESKPMSGPVHRTAARIDKPAQPSVDPARTTDDLLGLAVGASAAKQIVTILQTRSDEATLRSLRRAATVGAPAQRTVALRILGERGFAEFLEDAVQFLRNESRLAPPERKEHQIRRAYLRYLERLPAAVTLDRARGWFNDVWPLSLAGECVLARHATEADRPMVESAGRSALVAGDMYRLCSVVDSLSTIGSGESIPILYEIYSLAPYSYARRRVLRALVAHVEGNSIAYDLVTEALWDCEAEAREHACGAAPFRHIEHTRRLAELADDPFEEVAVREAAGLKHSSMEER